MDPEDILKTFFGGRDSPFGFATSNRGFEDFNEVQQVGFKFFYCVNDKHFGECCTCNLPIF